MEESGRTTPGRKPHCALRIAFSSATPRNARSGILNRLGTIQLPLEQGVTSILTTNPGNRRVVLWLETEDWPAANIRVAAIATGLAVIIVDKINPRIMFRDALLV